MDLDHIRFLLGLDEVRYTDEFDRMLQAREFTAEQARQVVLEGRVVDEERRKGRATKLIVQHTLQRGETVYDDLVVEVSVTDAVIFISGYWPGDGPRQRK